MLILFFLDQCPSFWYFCNRSLKPVIVNMIMKATAGMLLTSWFTSVPLIIVCMVSLICISNYWVENMYLLYKEVSLYSDSRGFKILNWFLNTWDTTDITTDLTNVLYFYRNNEHTRWFSQETGPHTWRLLNNVRVVIPGKKQTWRQIVVVSWLHLFVLSFVSKTSPIIL